MKTVGKVIIGIAVAGIVAVVAKKAYGKVHEKKYTTMKSGASEEEAKNPSKFKETLDRIKEAAGKKALEILAWASDHKKEVAGLGILVKAGCDIVSGYFAVSGGIKSYRKSGRIADILSDLRGKVRDEAYDVGWRDSTNDVLHCMREAIKSNSPFRIITDKGDVLAAFNVQEVAAV